MEPYWLISMVEQKICTKRSADVAPIIVVVIRVIWDDRKKRISRCGRHDEAVASLGVAPGRYSAHRAVNARVFGSAIHGDDTEDSDLDILIDPTPETTLLDIGAIRHELLQLLGVPVDVVTPKALPEKFRATVLAEAVPV